MKHASKSILTIFQKNFEKINAQEDFIIFSSAPENFDIIERIIRSDELFVGSEDSLLSFIIKLSKKNRIFLSLFELVFLEYCSCEQCEIFSRFMQELYQNHEIKSILKCVGRRITKDANIKSSINKGRYKVKEPINQEIVVNYNESNHGIFFLENEKGNVSFEGTSPGLASSFKPINIMKGELFQTTHEINSKFELSLKNKASFVIKEYIVKWHKHGETNCQLTNWKLEGRKISDRNWTQIDTQSNQRIGNDKSEKYSISNKERFNAVRLTQVGTNTSNNYYLALSGFDVFGIIIQ